jgi:proteic killer suppression protein
MVTTLTPGHVCFLMKLTLARDLFAANGGNEVERQIFIHDVLRLGFLENFKCKSTKELWEKGASKKIPASLRSAALRKLVLIDDAEEYKDLMVPPGNRLETLKGDREGQHSSTTHLQRGAYYRGGEIQEGYSLSILY